MSIQTLHLFSENSSDRKQAVRLLTSGEIVAVPTETVYGLAADARNPIAVEKIFLAKGRPSTHPLIVHIASVDELSEWAQDLPPAAFVLAEHFWPGPLTLLLKKASAVNAVVTGGLDTIGIRVPQHPVLLEILQKLRSGVAAPSANPHKRVSPTTAEHVLKGLSGKIAAVLDAGPCELGVESTILDLTASVPRILRPGPITRAMLEAVLKCSVELPDTHDSIVAGNMPVHYQPHTHAVLMSAEKIREFAPGAKQESRVLLHYSELPRLPEWIHTIRMPSTKSEYAKVLYQTLHEVDQLDFTQILIEAPPETEEWQDVWDRLKKATSRL